MYQPLHRHRPAHRWTHGDLAAKVGADLGLPPDEEQRWILDTIYGEKAPERPSCFEVAVISPRQNIKTSTLGIAALADLFVFGVERHLWTAHHGDTLKGTFNDFKSWITSNPDYDEQVTFYEGHQDMSIVHKDTGNVLDFQSRTGKAGRGLTGVKRITLDEALYLEPKHVGAVYPTMLTRPGAQVRIGSSAGLLPSEQLRRIRDRGRTGKDRRLAYVEYGAAVKPCLRTDCTHTLDTPGCSLDDRDLWWQANCALWQGRIGEESLEDMRRSMPPDEFMREFLSWWEDPVSQGGALPFDRWLELRDPNAVRGEAVVFGLDVAADRAAWVAVAWHRPDGLAQVQMVDVEAFPAAELANRAAGLSKKWGGLFVPPHAFEADLTREGVPIAKCNGTDFAGACGDVIDAVKAGTLRHGNQDVLNRAVQVARLRPPTPSGGPLGWLLKDAPEIGPLVAATRALYGLSVGSVPQVHEWPDDDDLLADGEA